MLKRSCESCVLYEQCNNIPLDPESLVKMYEDLAPSASTEARELAVIRIGEMSLGFRRARPDCSGWGSMKLLLTYPIIYFLDDASGTYRWDMKSRTCGNPYLQSTVYQDILEVTDPSNIQMVYEAFVHGEPRDPGAA